MPDTYIDTFLHDKYMHVKYVYILHHTTLYHIIVYSILFYSILFYSILFYSILCIQVDDILNQSNQDSRHSPAMPSICVYMSVYHMYVYMSYV